MKVVVVLDNIRSVYNVGAILRSCEGFGVSDAVFAGYTPFPGVEINTGVAENETGADWKRTEAATPKVLPHVAEKWKRQIAKTALGAEKLVKCRYKADLAGYLRAEIASGAVVVALENNISDSRMRRLSEVKALLAGSGRVILVLGEEVAGVNEGLYPYVTYFAEIPMRGQKESFNVSVAAGIALYELTDA